MEQKGNMLGSRASPLGISAGRRTLVQFLLPSTLCKVPSPGPALKVVLEFYSFVGNRLLRAICKTVCMEKIHFELQRRTNQHIKEHWDVILLIMGNTHPQSQYLPSTQRSHRCNPWHFNTPLLTIPSERELTHRFSIEERREREKH